MKGVFDNMIQHPIRTAIVINSIAAGTIMIMRGIRMFRK